MKTIRMTSMARRCLALGIAFIPWGQTAVKVQVEFELWDEPPKPKVGANAPTPKK